MLELIHVSDLHLALPYGVHRAILDILQRVQSIRGGSYLTELYSYAFEQAQDELANAIRQNVAGGETLLVLSGDIVAAPYDRFDDINGVYYPYITSLIHAAGAADLVAILGNHDWPLNGPTPFQRTHFDQHKITEIPRYEYFRGSTATLIFFLVDTTTKILPAWGKIPDTTLQVLPTWFDLGHKGHLRFSNGVTFPGPEYDAALKIVILHHSPLPRAAYGRRWSRLQHILQQLTNGPKLIDICKGEIDLFLFGHSHLPCLATLDGMILIDTGSTLGTDSGTSPLDAQFQIIQIHDTGKIVVASYRWEEGLAKTFGSVRPISFARDSKRQWNETP